MKIGISSGGYLNKYGISEGARRMKRHGYDCVDFQALADTDNELFTASDYASKLREIKNILNSEGITVSQTHGPWRYPPMDYTAEQRNERFEKMSKAIEMTALLGSENFVIHNIMPFGAADTDKAAAVEINREFFGRLLMVAEQHNVIICLENMPFPDQALARPADTLAFAKEFKSRNMRMCLDTGHSIVLGVTPGDAVRIIGKDYLYALHVHDNDGAHDQHLLPGEGVIDWNDFSDALNEIGFDGVVSLETSVQGSAEDNLDEAQLRLAEKVKKIAGIIL